MNGIVEAIKGGHNETGHERNTGKAAVPKTQNEHLPLSSPVLEPQRERRRAAVEAERRWRRWSSGDLQAAVCELLQSILQTSSICWTLIGWTDQFSTRGGELIQERALFVLLVQIAVLLESRVAKSCTTRPCLLLFGTCWLILDHCLDLLFHWQV